MIWTKKTKITNIVEVTILCEKITRRLQTAQPTQQHFTDAVVAGALASNVDVSEA